MLLDKERLVNTNFLRIVLLLKTKSYDAQNEFQSLKRSVKHQLRIDAKDILVNPLCTNLSVSLTPAALAHAICTCARA
jgi:hypothetical protein